MRKLDSEERYAIIDTLCEIPSITSPSERQSLLSTLPNDLKNNIQYEGAPKSHVTNIIDMVLDDNWFQLSDGSYPLVIVMQNALHKVQHSPLHAKLLKILDALSELQSTTSAQQDLEDHHLSIAHPFKEKLDSLTYAVKELNTEIQTFSASFNRRILRPECMAISKKLSEKSSFVQRYLEILQESSKLPSDVISNRIWIISELIACDQQIHIVKTAIDNFGVSYGTLVHQLVEERQHIQGQLEILFQRGLSILKAVEDMYVSLAEKKEPATDHFTTCQE